MKINKLVTILILLAVSCMLFAQARDPKTGRFIKKSSTMSGKKLPLRDPKTGRFISKKDLAKKYPKMAIHPTMGMHKPSMMAGHKMMPMMGHKVVSHPAMKVKKPMLKMKSKPAMKKKS